MSQIRSKLGLAENEDNRVRATKKPVQEEAPVGQAGAKVLLPIPGWGRDWQPRASSPKPVPHLHIILKGNSNSGQKLPGDGEERGQRDLGHNRKAAV